MLDQDGGISRRGPYGEGGLEGPCMCGWVGYRHPQESLDISPKGLSVIAGHVYRLWHSADFKLVCHGLKHGRMHASQTVRKATKLNCV